MPKRSEQAPGGPSGLLLRVASGRSPRSVRHLEGALDALRPKQIKRKNMKDKLICFGIVCILDFRIV